MDKQECKTDITLFSFQPTDVKNYAIRSPLGKGTRSQKARISSSSSVSTGPGGRLGGPDSEGGGGLAGGASTRRKKLNAF
uniref:Uncharacterized protein n=1 Tax=Romanomermis culicivorax TaxID=13658 RepID=A0A915LDT1_ROMCU